MERKTLDRNRPYGTVQGFFWYKHDQDGLTFNPHGIQIFSPEDADAVHRRISAGLPPDEVKEVPAVTTSPVKDDVRAAPAAPAVTTPTSKMFRPHALGRKAKAPDEF